MMKAIFKGNKFKDVDGDSFKVEIPLSLFDLLTSCITRYMAVSELNKKTSGWKRKKEINQVLDVSVEIITKLVMQEIYNTKKEKSVMIHLNKQHLKILSDICYVSKQNINQIGFKQEVIEEFFDWADYIYDTFMEVSDLY